jgi:hypothetical protein
MKNTQNKAENTRAKLGLTNTERTWRVSEYCYGIELLNMTQRHEVHNLKTLGYILDNVTPSGNALMSVNGANGYTSVCVFPSGKLDITHSNKN